MASLYGPDAGNATVPRKLQQQRLVRRRRRVIWLTGLAVLILSSGIGTWAWQRHGRLLRQAAAEAAAQGEKSVAVLPFENLSSEKDDAFFADGIQDDVLTTLGKVKKFPVIARASVMNYRGAALGGRLREIGKTLGVSHVLAGGPSFGE